MLLAFFVFQLCTSVSLSHNVNSSSLQDVQNMLKQYAMIERNIETKLQQYSLLQQNFQHMEQKATLMTHIYQEMEKNFHVIEQRYEVMQNNFEAMAKQLTSTVDTFGQTFKFMEHKFAIMHDKFAAMVTNSTLMHQRMTSYADENNTLTGRRSKRLPNDADVGRVAFSVYLDHTIEHLGIGQPVKYDRVLLNDGNNYNTHTGLFTVPQDGVYVFNFVISEFQVHQMYASLVIDGKQEVDGIADGIQSGQDVQGGNLAVLALTTGQTVWV